MLTQRISLFVLLTTATSCVQSPATDDTNSPAGSGGSAPLGETPVDEGDYEAIAEETRERFSLEPAPTRETPAASAGSNYGSALQASLFFFETNESGNLSTGNRVEWRGPAHTDDGGDVGRDLSGGWYDAGDHWKANTTMAFATSMLAWSFVQYPEAYTETKQLPILMNSLEFITDYFLRCIEDGAPDSLSDFSSYSVVAEIGGRHSLSREPGVHSVWCPPEVTDSYTFRDTLRVNPTIPGSDVAGAMSASLALSAIVFSRTGNLQYAAELLKRARKLYRFATTYRSYESSQAVLPDGTVTEAAFRGGDIDELIWAAVWMHRAEEELGSPSPVYLDEARSFMNAGGGFGEWWRDFGPHYDHGALLAWLQTNPSNLDGILAPFQEHISRWERAATDTPSETDRFHHSPYGLKVRVVYGGGHSASWVLPQSLLALMYSDYTQSETHKTRYYDYGKSQVDYFLGANAQNQSYMIGFGDAWPTFFHHRSAHGGWGGFDSLGSNNDTYLPFMRHVSYGAVLPGPDGNDYFNPDLLNANSTEATLNTTSAMSAALAAIVSRETDFDVQEDFPPREPRNWEGNDWATSEREFLVGAWMTAQTANSVTIETSLENRTGWPPRVATDLSFRIYAELSSPPQIATSGGAVVSDRLVDETGNTYYSISFPNERFVPTLLQGRDPARQYRRQATLVLEGTNLTEQFSLANLPTGAIQVVPRFPVFQGDVQVGGEAP